MRRHSNFHIPDELLMEILPILTFKTLGRFRCVSKHWKFLISNTTNGRNPNPKILLFSHMVEGSYHSIDHDTRIQSVHLPVEKRLLKGHNVKVHSSCNGLVLIQIDNNLFLWNPLTTFFHNVLTYDDLDWEGNNGFDCITDLCFDSVSNEYKVLMMINYRPWPCYIATCWSSCWKKIVRPRTIQNLYPGPFFNCYRHWFSKRGEGHYFNNYQFQDIGNHIFYFNPHKKLFVEVPMPNSDNGDKEFIVGLGYLDGCLCMSRWRGQGDIEFLLMKEYADGHSWEMFFVISSVPHHFCSNHIMDPLFKREVGRSKVLLRYTYHDRSRLKSYDFNNDSIRNISVRGADHKYLKVLLYEETRFQPTSPYLENCDYLLNANYVKEVIIGFDSGDFEYDEYSNVAISVFENSLGQEFHSRRKKIDKMKEKRSHHIKIAAQLSRKTEGKKRGKGNRRIDASECECCAPGPSWI